MKNNILIYNYDEPLPEQGGIERVTNLLAQELQKVGNKVYILCTNHNRLNKEYKAPAPTYYIPTRNQQQYILNCITNHKIDIIIDQTEGGFVGPYGYFKNKPKELNDTKLIAVQHSSRRAVLRNAKLIYGKTGANTIQECFAWLYNNTILKLRYLHFLWHARVVHKNLDINYDRTVTLSKSFIDDFIHYYPKARRDKIIAIPNPNTYETCKRSNLDKRVLFVGRLKNNPKGVDKLLYIWNELESKYPDWVLDIVGDGEDRIALTELAKKLNLKNVIFHGFQDPSQFYQKASIFCMTSMYEGFPMVLNEAMKHGIVPIVFNTFGAAEDIIDNGDCGFIIEPYDIDEYARRLSLLMSSREILSKMSHNAIAHSESFSRDKIMDMWQTLFESLS